MNTYIILLAAIVFEVLGTLLLPLSNNFTKFLPTSILLTSYGIAFYCLAIVSQKLPLSIVYATWSGLGIFLITVLSYFVYKQTINWQMLIGLLLIVMGVMLVNVYKT